MRYSVFNLLRQGLSGHVGWPRAWRSPEPKPRYRVIVIGGGGHGLATAYYLARLHGVTDVAVLERNWIGGGNTGRNTTIVRSNYLLEPNAHLYEHSLKLWEGLSQELNFNLMFSQRGVINTAHTDAQLDQLYRRGNAMRLNGIDAEMWTPAELKARVPQINIRGIDAEMWTPAELKARVPQINIRHDSRFPVLGALVQPRGGTARHDAVAWGYARAADRLGVDIIENCEVTGFRIENGHVTGVETTRGPIAAEKVGVAVAGHTSQVAALAGLRLPIESHVLQAMVSEPIKPVFDTVLSWGGGHFYVSQSDKGELVMGGNLDGYNSYAQRGNLPTIAHVIAAGVSVVPFISRLRMMRTWGGVVDMSMDGSPIIAKTPVQGLYLNGGWCYGGFKATPGSGWCFAHTIAKDHPHDLNAAFSIERFAEGRAIDERGRGPTPNEH